MSLYTADELMALYPALGGLSASRLWRLLAFIRYALEHSGSTDTGQMVEDAKCFRCLDAKRQLQGIVAAYAGLAIARGHFADLDDILEKAKCLDCVDPATIRGSIVDSAWRDSYTATLTLEPNRNHPLLPGFGIKLSWSDPPAEVTDVEISWNKNNTVWASLITLPLPHTDPLYGEVNMWQHSVAWAASDYAVYRLRFVAGSETFNWSAQRSFAQSIYTKVMCYDQYSLSMTTDVEAI